VLELAPASTWLATWPFGRQGNGFGDRTRSKTRGRSDACDIGREEVDAVAVEVATGAVIVLGGPWVGVSGEDLGVAQRDSGVEGIGDGG
jgi:hypothetical protein